MPTKPCIQVEVSNYVATVTLSNPKRRNAMSYIMWQQLIDTMATIANDPGVRVVVVRGDGELAFSAGADISEFNVWRSEPAKIEIYDDTVHRAQRALEHCPKPTIAAIRGFCIGGGFELALLCDIRLTTQEARFAVTPGRLGLGYTLDDTCILVSRLGASASREILFTARTYHADEALRLGIVNQVATGTDELYALVSEYTDQISENAPLTLQAAKTIIAEASKTPSDRDTALCDELVERCYRSDDFIEGRTAFAEKRKPVFQGR